MWQKKTTEGEVSEPALALRPAGARPAEDLSPYSSFDMEGHKEVIVPRQPRSHRFVWFLGLVLLVATALGAAWALNHGGAEQVGTSVAASPTPPGVVALGMVDNDPEIRKLRPPVAGKVVEIAAEGKLVKKGDRLLRLDERPAALLLREAEAALDNARTQLDLAKILPEKHKLEVKIQEKAIAAALKKIEALKQELDYNRELRKGKDPAVSQRALDIAEAEFARVELLAEIEKYKLLEIKLARPDLEVARAQHDVAAKEAERDKAKLAVEFCELLAPENGKVLRVFVNASEWISPDAKIPALQFCPTGKRIIRAEVLQEWSSLVERGQKVVIEDDTRAGPKWEGTVSQVSDWITHKRDVIIEPFMVNDVRTLECLIDVAPGGPPLRIGQRVRVTIQQGK